MSIVETLAGLKNKVNGDPAAIRKIATAMRTMGGHIATSTNKLVKNVAEVDKAWQGDSAQAFADYMAAYPAAGRKLKGALNSCASALDTAATKLETAHSTVSGLHEAATTAASNYRNDHSDATQTEIDNHIKQQLDDPVGKANQAVSTATTALSTAKTALHGQLGEHGFGFFKGIRQPGGADFSPGDRPIDWKRTAGYSPTSPTLLASAPGGPGSGPGGSGPGGGGTGGEGAGAPSSYGNAPAPKPQVVEWIKEAIRVIKSPEMAAILRKRGLDVSDLDPNDPKDIQRIWTIIHHESGGNPNAINNWDINARNGVPSQGLMQTIPPTFNAHALPGYGQIREPVDNIIAGVLYTYSRYGNLAEHPGIESLESGDPNARYKPY